MAHFPEQVAGPLGPGARGRGGGRFPPASRFGLNSRDVDRPGRRGTDHRSGRGHRGGVPPAERATISTRCGATTRRSGTLEHLLTVRDDVGCRWWAATSGPTPDRAAWCPVPTAGPELPGWRQVRRPEGRHRTLRPPGPGPGQRRVPRSRGPARLRRLPTPGPVPPRRYRRRRTRRPHRPGPASRPRLHEPSAPAGHHGAGRRGRRGALRVAGLRRVQALVARSRPRRRPPRPTPHNRRSVDHLGPVAPGRRTPPRRPPPSPRPRRQARPTPTTQPTQVVALTSTSTLGHLPGDQQPTTR